MKRSSRRPSKLSESLHQRLNSYALAASAAGVGAMALAQPSEAKIVYTKVHKVLHPGQSLSLDLNNDGLVDFRLYDTWFSDQDFGPTGWLTPHRAYSPDGVEGHTVNFGTGIVSVLPAGAKVGQNARFLYQTFPAVVMCHATDYGHQGRWCHTENRYLGMRFAIKKKIHYGWARLSTTTGKRAHITAMLTGYAYENIPNKPIIAGKTHGKDVVTIQPASLGALAAGRTLPAICSHHRGRRFSGLSSQ
jgi:hypothetical protein